MMSLYHRSFLPSSLLLLVVFPIASFVYGQQMVTNDANIDSLSFLLKGISINTSKIPLFQDTIIIKTSEPDPFRYSQRNYNSTLRNYGNLYDGYIEKEEQCILNINYHFLMISFLENPEKKRQYKGQHLPAVFLWEDIEKVFIGKSFISLYIKKYSNLRPLSFVEINEEQISTLMDIFKKLMSKYKYKLKFSKSIEKQEQSN